jgi:DNA-binding GntR family transcriptional regulator
MLEAFDDNGAAGSATDRVYHGVLRALDQHEIVPGQRLIETELALQFGVGRNAVREAIQRLAARGFVDLSRNRSPSIRRLSYAETVAVLEVAEVLIGLLARTAATRYNPRTHRAALQGAIKQLAECKASRDMQSFSRARRHFYRVLLDIAANGELIRLFAALQMQIVYAQFKSPHLLETRFDDYKQIAAAVVGGEPKAAESRAKQHVRNVLDIVTELCGEHSGH